MAEEITLNRTTKLLSFEIYLSLSFSRSQSLSLDRDLSLRAVLPLELDLDLERLLLCLGFNLLSVDLSVSCVIILAKASSSFFFCSLLHRRRRSRSFSASLSSSDFGSSSWRSSKSALSAKPMWSYKRKVKTQTNLSIYAIWSVFTEYQALVECMTCIVTKGWKTILVKKKTNKLKLPTPPLQKHEIRTDQTKLETF